MTALLAGLDVGTTTSKAVIFTETGQAVSQGRAPTPWRATSHGAEVDPVALIDSARHALNQAIATAPGGHVSAIGVASMGESGVLLDASGAPIGPVIAWHDTRDTDELGDLEMAVGRSRFAATTGLPLAQQWSVTKHRWLMSHDPAARMAVRRLNIAEWVIRAFGGDEVCERSLASRTGWLRLSDSTWWDEALTWSGARPSLMPSLVDAGAPAGRVVSQAGLPGAVGATLTAAGHDHQAAAIGAGAIGAGDQLDSCGTAEAIVRCVAPGLEPESLARLTDAGITVGWHALAGRWCLMGATTGGLTMQRVMSLIGADRTDLPALDALALESDGRGLRVTADGSRTAISGIGDVVHPADVWRATLESVTGEILELHNAMSDVSGRHTKLVVTGGWAKSAALLVVKEAHLGEVHHPNVLEAGARGAALLAGLAAGVYSGPSEFPIPQPAARSGIAPSAIQDLSTAPHEHAATKETP